MLRSFIRNLDSECIFKIHRNRLFFPISIQVAKYKRKPRWLPIAKSKMFRIPERPKIPIEEEEELKRLHSHYKTAMKSLSAYFADRTARLKTGEEVIAEFKRKEEEEHLKCLELNDEWNREVALLREQRLAKEKEIQLENIVRALEENERLMKERKEKIEAIVREEKEKSLQYITQENIDAAIEYALTTVVDHNFAIDLEGKYYKGRNTKPPKLMRESENLSEAASVS